MTPILTAVVPCFNSEEYMARCIDSLLYPVLEDVEVVIVNDGSTDGTARIADEYAAAHPDRVRVVHKENGGHGSGINAGLNAARGTYFKVVDSDDWLDPAAFVRVIELLRRLERQDHRLDLLVTNFVYEKQGKRIKRVVDYRRALPRNRVFSWDEVGSFHTWQYLLMHSIIYRTGLLKECALEVPEHSFYVDNYFAFVPLSRARKIGYLDVDLYRYFIGRDDQSVNEKIMIDRIDQQLNINLLMVKHLSQARQQEEMPASLERYMTRYATLVTVVSSVLLVRAKTEEALEKKRLLWEEIDEIDPEIAKQMRRSPLGAIVSRDSLPVRGTMHCGYHLSKLLVGFN